MSRDTGDKLEDKVSHDLGVTKTTNSGAKWDNADLTNKKYIVECKVKNKDGFQPCKAEIKKLITQAIKHDKEWVYVQQTLDKIYVVIDYNLFLELYSK
jgi:ribosomal protein S24E